MKFLSKLFVTLVGIILPFFSEAHVSFKQLATLTPTLPGMAVLGDSFGEVLFISDEFVFVGAPVTTPVDNKFISGAVYVYKKKNQDQWINTQIITTDGLLDHLSALKIYATKNWLFIAATGTPIGPVPNDIPMNQNFTGAILIYKRDKNNDQWIFTQSIDRQTPGLEDLSVASPGAVTPPPVPFLLVENGATFGVSFDVNPDKELLLVGAPGQINLDSNHSPIMNSGTVYAFKLHEGHWKFIQKFTNPDGVTSNDSFGGQVVIHKKYALISNTLITTPHINSNSNVYLYHFERGKWRFVQKIEGDEASNTLVEIKVWGGNTPFQLSPNFGGSIAADEEWVVIGAPYENLGTNQLKGAAYFYKFTRNKGTKKLVRMQKIVSDDSNTLFTGIATAINSNLAVIGDPGHVGPQGEQAQGGILVYRRKGDHWAKETVLFDDGGFPFQLFGNGVAVKDNLIIGGAGNAFIGSVVLTSVPEFIPLPAPLAQNKVVIWKRKDKDNHQESCHCD